MRFYKSLRTGDKPADKGNSTKQVDSEKHKDKMRKLLLAKFKHKYENSIPESVVLSHVNRFLDTSHLTAANLEALEDEILKAVGRTRPPPEPKAPKSKEAQSVKGKGSSRAAPTRKPQKTQKHTQKKQEQPAAQTVEDPLFMGEDDEWAEVMKYNNELYKEERRQELLQKERVKRHLKSELDRQIQEKEDQKRRFEQEDKNYSEYEQERLKKVNEEERKKEEERRRKVQYERDMRDRQRREDEMRRELEDRESKEQEQMMVERMLEELEVERKFEQEKRLVEKETLKRIMEEGKRQKEQQKALSMREREEDVKRQEMQSKIAEMQEKEYKENMRRKDERNKLLIENSMKHGGAKASKEEAEMEDRKMREQMQIIERRQDEEEELRVLASLEAKKNMKKILDKQIEEHKQKKQLEKSEDLVQAAMWRQEQELAKRQEEANAQRQKDSNMRHQDYLLTQIEVSKGPGKSGLTRREHLQNRKLASETKATKEKLRTRQVGAK
eukprot:TRINITY_DN1803_c0_g1_i8.p1 TRINITY_DN1803_c0_g1~~TRINITY_DN1803_c0_g1_i8.p1  ORF type:complete len:499 (-),score=248.08 TRINITY_DN1803_c0_g1_i8:199-1695(-)